MDHPTEPTPVEQFGEQTGYTAEQIVEWIRDGKLCGEQRADGWYVLPNPVRPPTPRVSPQLPPVSSGAKRFFGDMLLAGSVFAFLAVAVGVSVDAMRYAYLDDDGQILLILSVVVASAAWALGRKLTGK